MTTISQCIFALARETGGVYDYFSGESEEIKWENGGKDPLILGFRVDRNAHDVRFYQEGTWEEEKLTEMLKQFLVIVKQEKVSMVVSSIGSSTQERLIEAGYPFSHSDAEWSLGVCVIGPQAEHALDVFSALPFQDAYGLPFDYLKGGWKGEKKVALSLNARIGGVELSYIKQGGFKDEKGEVFRTFEKASHYYEEQEQYMRKRTILSNGCEEHGATFVESFHPDLEVYGECVFPTHRYSVCSLGDVIQANQKEKDAIFLMEEAKKSIESVIRTVYPAFQWGKEMDVLGLVSACEIKRVNGMYATTFFTHSNHSNEYISDIHQVTEWFHLVWNERTRLDSALRARTDTENVYRQWEIRHFRLLGEKMGIRWVVRPPEKERRQGWGVESTETESVIDHITRYCDAKRSHAQLREALKRWADSEGVVCTENDESLVFNLYQGTVVCRTGFNSTELFFRFSRSDKGTREEKIYGKVYEDVAKQALDYMKNRFEEQRIRHLLS